MADGRKAVNIRIGSVHVISGRGFPWLFVHVNAGHKVGGEFRSKPEWRPFAVYRFFGMV